MYWCIPSFNSVDVAWSCLGSLFQKSFSSFCLQLATRPTLCLVSRFPIARNLLLNFKMFALFFSRQLVADCTTMVSSVTPRFIIAQRSLLSEACHLTLHYLLTPKVWHSHNKCIFNAGNTWGVAPSACIFPFHHPHGGNCKRHPLHVKVVVSVFILDLWLCFFISWCCQCPHKIYVTLQASRGWL